MVATGIVRSVLGLLGASLALFLPTEAAAQTKQPRVTVGVGGAFQTGTSDVSSTVAFTAHAEAGGFSWTLPVAPGAALDASARVRLWRRLGLGVGYSSFSADGSADITARVPHPFFFNQARAIQGQASLERQETALRLCAVLESTPGRRLQAAAFAGPVHFSVTQGLVESVSYSESYPYDTATFSSAVTKPTRRTKVGLGAGIDLAYYFSKRLGVGAGASFAAATMTAKAADDTNVTIKVGGTLLGLGLRLRF